MSKSTLRCNCNAENSVFSLINPLKLLFRNASPCWRALEWENRSSFPSNSAEIYTNLCESSSAAQFPDINQIDLDLNRTFPLNKVFNAEYRDSLRRILISISIYDPSVGYVQGMNFLAAALLWHTSEIKAFWLMISLLYQYDLRQNYLPGLPGLSKHSQILELLLFEQYPNYFCYLNEHRAGVAVYITEWCFTLFAKVVPVKDMGVVLHEFFKNSWCFFYKLVLVIILRLKEKVLALKDPADILTVIKPSEVYKRGKYDFLKAISAGDEGLTWKRLIEEAEGVELDKGHVEFLGLSLEGRC